MFGKHIRALLSTMFDKYIGALLFSVPIVWLIILCFIY